MIRKYRYYLRLSGILILREMSMLITGEINGGMVDEENSILYNIFGGFTMF